MGRIVRSVALGLSLLSSLLVGVAIAAHAQAPIGTEVPYVDADGVARGTVLIKELSDPFTGNDPARPAPDGQRYIGLSVAFTAADDQSFNANPSYIILRATDGHLYQPGYVPRLPDELSPDLQAQTMAPGNRVSGFIGYTVPTDAVIEEITYTDSTYRALPLADLVPTAGPAADTPVDYVADDGTKGQFTITVADPFTDFDPTYPAPEGSRYVGLDIVATDPGEAPFQVTPNQFYLRDATGNLYYPANVYRPEGAKLPVLEGQPLAAGDRISGFLGFAVPADAPVVAVDLWPGGARRVTIVDLVGGGPAPSAGPAGSPAPVASEAPVASPAPVASLAPAPSPTPAQSAGTSQ